MLGAVAKLGAHLSMSAALLGLVSAAATHRAAMCETAKALAGEHSQRSTSVHNVRGSVHNVHTCADPCTLCTDLKSVHNVHGFCKSVHIH